MPKLNDARWNLSYREQDDVRIAEISPAKVNELYAAGCVHAPGRDNEWSGGTPESTGNRLRNGYHGANDRAMRIAAAVDVAVREMAMTPTLTSHVCGGAVCVPAALSGSPMAFQRLMPQPAKQGVRICADMFVSAGFEPSQVESRGLAILALARTMARFQPVKLDLLCSRGKGSHLPAIVKIPLGVNPVDWSAASALIGHPTGFRHFGLAACTILTDTPPDGLRDGHPPLYDTQQIRTLCGLAPRDIFIGPMTHGRRDMPPLDGNPQTIAAWVKEQVKQYQS